MKILNVKDEQGKELKLQFYPTAIDEEDGQIKFVHTSSYGNKGYIKYQGNKEIESMDLFILQSKIHREDTLIRAELSQL